MSIGLRDQRVRVYGYDNGGDEGRVSETYPYVGEYWARVTAPSGREATIAAQAEEVVDALVFFSDEVTVPGDGILKLGPIVYKVLSTSPARMGREIVARVAHAESATFVLTGEP